MDSRGNSKSNGKRRNGKDRDANGKFLPGHTVRSTVEQRKTGLVARLKAAADEAGAVIRDEQGNIVETISREQLLARKVWSAALEEGEHDVRLVLQGRSLIFERLAPVPRDGVEINVIPQQTAMYTPHAMTFLENLDKSTGGHPSTHDTLRALMDVPIERLLTNGNGKPANEAE